MRYRRRSFGYRRGRAGRRGRTTLRRRIGYRF
jgi:hypothetical protein